jgi:hypothetical protein
MRLPRGPLFIMMGACGVSGNLGRLWTRAPDSYSAKLSSAIFSESRVSHSVLSVSDFHGLVMNAIILVAKATLDERPDVKMMSIWGRF